MNWEKKDEKDKIENQFMKTMSRQSRTQTTMSPRPLVKCGLLELRGGRTFRRKQKLKIITPSTSIIVAGVSTVLRASREWPNT